MKGARAFISFEFDRDYELKENFVRQAELRASAPTIEDTSLKHSYHESEWRDHAERAISRSDLVFVIVGQDTHNAPGVLEEIRIANRLGKAILQVRPQGKTHGELEGAGRLYAWRWKTIEKAVERLLNDRSM